MQCTSNWARQVIRGFEVLPSPKPPAWCFSTKEVHKSQDIHSPNYLWRKKVGFHPKCLKIEFCHKRISKSLSALTYKGVLVALDILQNVFSL